MRVILEGERRIRVDARGETLAVESTDPDLNFSPLHMLAASLATCTVSVLAGWALQAGIGVDDLEIALDWEYVDDPYRVDRYDLSLRWPGLPDERHAAALRVAEHCTVEHTLTHPPTIDIGIGD